MQDYQRILVALDVYSSYNEILERALRIANDPIQIHLAFVTIPTFYFQPYVAADGGDITADIRQQATKRLDDIAFQYGIPNNQIYVPIGHPADEVHLLAKKVNADLIVLGTQGQSSVELLLGSTANAVMQGVNCDILAVKII